MVFLGLLFNKDEERQIASKSRNGFVQNQVNNFQWNCIDGLYENGIDNLQIINCLPVGTYPNAYSDIVIHSKEWTYHDNTHYQLGSLNVPIIKQWWRYRACKRMLSRLQDKDVLVYSPYQPFLKAIKHLDETYNVTLIVPDLPEYYDYTKVGTIRKIVRKINNYSISRCMNRVNRFVLLTDAMKDPLKVGNRPYIVVEGICSADTPKSASKKLSNKKIILYAGSLNKKFGVDILIDAFRQIPNVNYELWICGSGDYQDIISTITEKDKRIQFFGFVSKEKVLEMQAEATVLVNPRQNIGDYTRYSFPSKMMEYLLSGVPVVAYKLDGIPSEYDPFIYYVENNSSKSLSKALIEVCEDIDDRYKMMAREARIFISTQKNPKTQAHKIMKLLGNHVSNQKDV